MQKPRGLALNMPYKGACFDGDADRLIYFKWSKESEIPTIIDGDK